MTRKMNFIYLIIALELKDYDYGSMILFFFIIITCFHTTLRIGRNSLDLLKISSYYNTSLEDFSC
jgi:hypothetical protein